MPDCALLRLGFMIIEVADLGIGAALSGTPLSGQIRSRLVASSCTDGMVSPLTATVFCTDGMASIAAASSLIATDMDDSSELIF
jgi:hypothetical protein